MKILVVRFSSIGDIVLTSPVLRNVKFQRREVELHYLTKSFYADILRRNPNVDRVFTIQQSIKEVLPALAVEKYDLIIDLHHNLRTFLLKRRLGVHSHSFRKLNIQKWLLVRFGWNRMPDLHVVDRYMETVSSLGITNDGMGLDYFISEEDQVPLNELPVTHRKGYIAFAIGGQYAGKKLPSQKLTDLCRTISHPIVLLGGKEDQAVAERICAQCGDGVWNACGRFSLNQSASLIAQSKLVIAHDTGLMHIAAAFKKKIISLWGCTSPAFGMFPYLPDPASVQIQPDHLRKRPCSKLGDSCKYGHFQCAQELENERILRAVDALY